MKAHTLFIYLSPVLFLALHLPSQAVQEPIGPYNDHFYPTRIEVKIVEGSGAILVDGKLQSRKGEDLTSVAKVFAGAKSVERLFKLPLETLDKWHAETRGGTLPDPDHLGLWFRVTSKDAAHGKELLAALREEKKVQHTYMEPVPELPGGSDIAPPTPLFDAKQGYAGVPPKGVNSDASHTIIGGRGRGIVVTDMEVYWTGEHEDLLAMDAADVFLGKKYISSSGAHGTAVAGEIVGDRNGYGVRGISDMVKYHVSSWNDGGVSGAILRGVNKGKAGDIVLLEVHYRTSVGYLPAEAFTSNYNVILTGTKKGVHICEAAGNGNVNLNTVAYGGQPSGFLDPSSSKFRESGAIMIGATNGSSTARAGFSNYGRRITANGWGYQVTTTGYGGLFKPNNDIRQYYTSTFSGTSSASPIVTAVVADLSGAVKFQNDKILTINQVRDLLKKFGTPCTGSIGKRPDLKAMLKDLGLPDGLFQSKASYSIGEDYVTDMIGPAPRKMALFLSEKLNPVSIGLNRKFHLDIPSMILIGIYSLPSQLKVKIPNIPALKGKDFYFQGIDSSSFVTNSTQAWIK
jgi:hypothetical protein